jgi:beta-glucanase (GH16 family)
MSNRKILPSFIVCLLAQCAGGVFAQDVPKPLAKLGGYELVFHDEFDNLDLSPDSHGKHTWYEGVWFNKHHVPLSSISASGGMLTLTWNRGQEQVDTSITTLSHDTKNFHAWKYGYFEARMKWDQVNGAWPAFWLIPVQDANRKDLYDGVRESGEVDILEGQGDHPHNIYTTVHDWVNGKDSANRNNVVKLPGDVDLAQFHTYGLLWTPGKLVWYFDGKEVHSESAAPIFDQQDYYMVISMQEASHWKSGDLSGVTATSMNLTVDWVRVWQQK